MKRLLELLAALLIVGILGSCDLIMGPNEPVGSGIGSAGGSLSISFGEGRAAGSRAITTGAELPGEVLAGMSYKVVLTGPGGEVIELTVSGGETITRTVAAGQWRIDAQGYYLDALAGTGSVTLVVQAGDNPVRIPMMMSGPCYEVSADPGIEHGTVQTNFALAFEGTPVTLTPVPDEGYALKDGTLAYNGGSVAGPPYTFTMPAGDVRVSAEFEPLYNVTVAQLSGGTVIADIASAVEGTVITLSVVPASGYALKAGTLKYNGTTINSSPYTFTMPASDVTLTAEFDLLYRVIIAPLTGGTVTANFASSVEGTTITLTVTPDSGYALKTGTLKYNDGSDHVIAGPAYAFILSDSDVTVSAEFIQFVRYVRMGGAGDGTSWDNASNDIQVMMDALEAIDYTGPRIVKVAAGTYKPQYVPTNGVSANGTPDRTTTASTSRDSAFILRKGVQVWGGYPISGGDDASRNIVTNETILSGDIGAPGNGDNAYHVVLAMGVDRKTVLSGLTITGGNANVISIISVLGSNAVYRHYGGGIYSGTVDASRSYSPVLVNVKISGNSASHINSLGGGMYNDKAKPVLINVLVSGNTSSNRGGGIFNIAGSSLFLTNVTVSGNSATNNGGAIDSDSSSLTIWNSVVWGNSNGIGSPATISNSIVQGGWGGSNNQNVDPSFAGSGDYRLNGGSPAINAGDSGSYPDTWAKWSSLIGDDEGITTEDDYNMYIAPHLGKDLAGHTRIQGTAIDMGAYEKN